MGSFVDMLRREGVTPVALGEIVKALSDRLVEQTAPRPCVCGGKVRCQGWDAHGSLAWECGGCKSMMTVGGRYPGSFQQVFERKAKA